MIAYPELLFDTGSEVGRAVRANLEPSYIAYAGGPGLDPLILEANLAPNFSILPSPWRAALILTPKVVFRMFAEESTPVKTPSYMPRVTAFAWLQQDLNTPAFYAGFQLGHHSNGQSGPFFAPDGSNNHEDGDFATNSLELSLSRVTRSSMFFGWVTFALEWHPGIGQSDELDGRYGLVRLHVASTIVRRLALDGNFYVELSAILGQLETSADSPLERFPLHMRYTARLPLVNLGMFASAYVGQDYYNIWFDRTLFALMVGVSGDLWATPHQP